MSQSETTKTRLRPETRSNVLLKRPLTADTAVQIALLNNRGLQADYNELAIAEAAMVGASLPPNPTISLSRIAGSGEVEIERRIIADILALATLPVRSERAADRFRQAQLRAIAATLRVAAEARRAYYRAVAARELVGFLSQAQTAAETATQLAKRLGESGALNKLDQAREQVLYADITTQVAVARQRAGSERERLIRVLGLWGDDLNFRIGKRAARCCRVGRRLCRRSKQRPSAAVSICRSRGSRLPRSPSPTVSPRRRVSSACSKSAGVSKTTRPPEGDSVRQRGIEVEFAVPLFDFGQVRVRAAEQTYMEAVNRLVEKAVNVRSEARDAYRIYRSTYDIAAHYQREVLPLRQIISEEMLLRYNAMQIDVFALLAEARQRIAATTAAIEAHRDFWLAHTNLFVAIVGGSPASDIGESSRPTVAPPAEPAGH